MDERVQDHAEVIVDHSTGVEAGDDVMISMPRGAEDLAEAIAERVGERGGTLHTTLRADESSSIHAAYLRAVDPEAIETPEHALALGEASDVIITIRGGTPLSEQSDIAEETTAAFQAAQAPLRDLLMNETTWCGTQYPSGGYAQQAGMSTRAYEDFVWDAIVRDWDAVREHQTQLVDILEDGSAVHIESGDTTDLRASIDGMHAVNDYGEKNLPGGEVFTAPVVDSVQGEVLFDVPVHFRSRELADVRLTFEDGNVTDAAAAEGEALLETLLETAGGDRLGELGFGMNRDIDRPTRNMLLDEKMGDTVHMALGMAISDTVGDNREANESDIHVDLVVDMSEDSRIAVDGETIYEDGWYVFEDGPTE